MGNNEQHRSPDKEPLKRGSLDTIAQLGTKGKKKHKKGCSCCRHDDEIRLNKSTTVNDKKPLQNRAKRKYLATSLSLNLVSIAEKKRDKAELENFKEFNENQSSVKSYWLMYHCASKLEHNNGKVTGRYCKNRLCLVCNSIRQAQVSARYSPVIKEWGEDVYFVTVTVPNMKGELLSSSLDEMHSIYKKIQERLKKQYQRGQREKFIAIKKLEGTYNPIMVTYHPHYHFLIKGADNANSFLDMWLTDTKHLGTNRKAQDIRKADVNAPRELFKYFTKIISSSDKEKRIFVDALDVIYKAMKGRRTFQSIGFKLPKEEKLKDEDFELPLELEAEYQGEEEETYIWIQEQADWVSNVTGVLLSDYKLSKSLQELPKRMITTINNST